MSFELNFTKDNLGFYLKELSKIFRKLNGTKMPAEIILIGGAAILVNYGFRDMTNDIDAIIHASSAMKEAINFVGDKFQLPNGWLNTDFTRTKSYSDRLTQVSVYFNTYSNILSVRTIAAEYLIAMKLVSGRQYKNDLSDIAGVLWEHKKNGNPISYEMIDNAVVELYGGWSDVSDRIRIILSEVFKSGDFEKLYNDTRKSEIESKKVLIEFEGKYPDALKNGDDVNSFLENIHKTKSERKENAEIFPAENGKQ